MLLENENTIKKAKFQSIKDGRFLKGLQIKIIIHGYTQWRNNDAMINLRKEYFKNGKWNIIYIDYKKLAEMKCYIKLFWNVPAIGKCGAAFIKKLLELRGKEIKCAQLDVVAFSIGAHIAAQISNNLPFKCLPRITGIDPALPIFFFLPVSSQEKLNRQHAKFVVVIHSNAGVLGVLYSDAHIDIYANNGKIQPGCEIWNYQCSHRRSLEYFAESINSQIGFIATKCDYFLIIFKRCILKSDKTVLVGEYCEPVKSVNYEDGYQMFLENENTIKNALFVSGAHPKGIGIKIVIHGYAQSRNSETMIRLRQEYFINNKKWNVLYIDFEKLAQDYCYVQLFESVPIIGKCASQFLRLLVQLRPDITCDQLDVLAFSIGCHVAAETSNNFPLRIPNSSIQPLPTDCFSRIIGNDPASPLFYKNLVTVQNKLNKQHAKFVMAIHTTVLVGVISSQAHVDAYANNSIHQPGCGYTDLRCSHLRALLYFIESINSNVGFTATKCDYFIPVVGKCAVLGDNTIRVGEPCKAVQEKDQGNYVFNTNEKPPFAKSVTNL